MLTHYALLSLSFKEILLFAPILTTYLFLGFQAHGCIRVPHQSSWAFPYCWMQWALSILVTNVPQHESPSPSPLDLALRTPLSPGLLPTFPLSLLRLPARSCRFNLLNIGVLWGPGHALTSSCYVLFNHHHSRWVPHCISSQNYILNSSDIHPIAPISM